MPEQSQSREDMWSFLEHNVLAPSTLTDKVSIPEGFDWLQQVDKWRKAYRAQSLWLGSRMKYGSLQPTPVKSAPERLSRRLKRLSKLEARSSNIVLFDEHLRLDWVFPTTHYTILEDGTVINNMTMTGESVIERRIAGIQALPKVSRVRGKRHRNR